LSDVLGVKWETETFLDGEGEGGKGLVIPSGTAPDVVFVEAFCLTEVVLNQDGLTVISKDDERDGKVFLLHLLFWDLAEIFLEDKIILLILLFHGGRVEIVLLNVLGGRLVKDSGKLRVEFPK
jgi:hypothetical protein